ncbi:helix-turn-helix transcriptional regulator [Pseudonocardia eucalypti]|uniref:Helix-turn-helix transcriptional regulator n=1 Tax=Pseudonocardia eucalypti TaxID=648755 RepID=A0ABP9PMP6_9PSEU|nr:AraC-like DNA-binding protein [Pseudonocardia eucalypti]
MNETAIYREEPAPAGWGPAAYRVWYQRAAGGHRQLVLPDGCADVIVDDRGRAILVGSATGAQTPLMAPGRGLHGLRLASAGIRAALGVPAAELTDRTLPLDQVLPGPLARALVDALGTGDPLATDHVRHWLAGAEPDPRIAVAARVLWRSPSRDVAEVADLVGLSGRQLRRALLADVGLGPKAYQRVGRLHRFLALARADGTAGLAELAARAGYADQPHLSREARALSGLSPSALLDHQLSPAGTPPPAPVRPAARTG